MAWLSTLRIRTLPAAATPVIVAMALAWRQDVFALLPALAALVGALLIQIGTNLANDYYDHKKGADTPERVGPVRASASGALRPESVRNAAYAVMGLAVLVGVYLVWVGGWPILAIGAAAVLAGILYTAGPRPLGYVGLGDVFVFVFFGPVAVMGTVYVQAAAVGAGFGPALWMPGLFWGMAMGALSTAILVVNNLRDAATDAAAGKRTLAVRFGPRFARIEWTVAVAGAFALSALAAGRHEEWLFALPLLSLPLAVTTGRIVWTMDRAALNPALGGTARLLLVFGLLAAAGML